MLQPDIREIVTFSVKSDGRAIDDEIRVLSAQVLHSENEDASALIRISDGLPGENKFLVTDGETFSLGRQIEIFAGYEDRNTEIYGGAVSTLKLDFTQESESILSVYCDHQPEELQKTTRSPGAPQPVGSPDLELSYGDNILEFSGSCTAEGLFGTVKMPGYAEIRVGHNLMLKGLGNRFGQMVRIVELSHEIIGDNWTTDLKFERLSSG